MHLFTEYGAMVARTMEGQKPFQHLEVCVCVCLCVVYCLDYGDCGTTAHHCDR